jgi:hypothetical protein
MRGAGAASERHAPSKHCQFELSSNLESDDLAPGSELGMTGGGFVAGALGGAIGNLNKA